MPNLMRDRQQAKDESLIDFVNMAALKHRTDFLRERLRCGRQNYTRGRGIETIEQPKFFPGRRSFFRAAPWKLARAPIITLRTDFIVGLKQRTNTVFRLVGMRKDTDR